MRRLILLTLLLLPVSLAGPVWANDEPHLSSLNSPSITVVPIAPNFTELQGSDGSYTLITQQTLNSWMYSTRDREGRETTGMIFAPYPVTPREPWTLPPSSFRPIDSIYDRR